jgi:PilZ domain
MEANSPQLARAPEQERRSEQRFPLRLPIQVKCLAASVVEATAFTRDISARGAYFFLDSGLREGARVEITVTLPAQVTLAGELHVRCKGRVVRVNQSELIAKIGIALAIEQYDFTALK